MKNENKNIQMNENNPIHKRHIHKKIFELLALVFFTFAGTASAFASEINTENVTFLINQQRAYYGLKPYHYSQQLEKAAIKKSTDMLDRNYFEHYAYGLTPWDFILSENYDYLYAGENLAMDFDTAEGMVRAWMASPTHRSNILSNDYEDMGVGIVKGAFTENEKEKETTMVTNMFGRNKPAILKVIDRFMRSLMNIF